MNYQSQSMNDLFQCKDRKKNSISPLDMKNFSRYSIYQLPLTPQDMQPNKFSEFDQEKKLKKIESLVRMCNSVRDKIEIEAEIRVREILTAKKKLLDEIDYYTKDKMDQIDANMIQRLKKMSQSIRNDLNLVTDLDDLESDSDIDEETIEFIPIRTNISLGELKLKSTKNCITFDKNAFNKIRLANLFKYDSFSDLDIFGIQYENESYFTIYTDTNLESKMLYWNHLTQKVSTLTSPKTISFISFMFKYNHLVLNYIHEPNQNYYLRVYEIDILNNNELIDKRLFNLYEQGYENLFLIGIDKSYIYCSSMNGLYVFDFNCKLVKSFGQVAKPDEAFYFGNNIKQIDTRNNKYYWLNDSSMNITNQSDGKLIKSFKLKADKFDFDSCGNLVVFSRMESMLLLVDPNGKIERICKLIDFPEISNFFIDKYDKIRFLNMSKCELYISHSSIYND